MFKILVAESEECKKPKQDKENGKKVKVAERVENAERLFCPFCSYRLLSALFLSLSFFAVSCVILQALEHCAQIQWQRANTCKTWKYQRDEQCSWEEAVCIMWEISCLQKKGHDQERVCPAFWAWGIEGSQIYRLSRRWKFLIAFRWELYEFLWELRKYWKNPSTSICSNFLMNSV